MGIQERNLPVAESLDEGAMVRIVDGEGHSKNIGADEIGSDNSIVNIAFYEDDGDYSCSMTYDEINQAIEDRKIFKNANSGISIIYDVHRDVSAGKIIFTYTSLLGSTFYLHCMYVTSSNDVESYSKSIPAD